MALGGEPAVEPDGQAGDGEHGQGSEQRMSDITIVIAIASVAPSPPDTSWDTLLLSTWLMASTSLVRRAISSPCTRRSKNSQRQMLELLEQIRPDVPHGALGGTGHHVARGAG